VFGFVIAQRISILVDRAVSKRYSRHLAQLFRRIVFYVLLFIFFISALQELGFKLTVLLGAAGVFTVALSFASQTAASNLVSGIFLLFERPFKVGDSIEVKGIVGILDSIDLLSTKLITPDNTLVRIANEVIMKSEIVNTSYFKTTRLSITIGVSYDDNLARVKTLLLSVTNECSLILNDPAPQVVINNFNDSTIELKLLLWVDTEAMGSVKNQLLEQLKLRFEQEEIDTQITLH